MATTIARRIFNYIIQSNSFGKAIMFNIWWNIFLWSNTITKFFHFIGCCQFLEDKTFKAKNINILFLVKVVYRLSLSLNRLHLLLNTKHKIKSLLSVKFLQNFVLTSLTYKYDRMKIVIPSILIFIICKCRLTCILENINCFYENGILLN